MMLIEKDKSMVEIREDLSMILDPATDEFIEWLGQYLEDEKAGNNLTNHGLTNAPRSAPVTLDTDLDDDQLDFEENIDDEATDKVEQSEAQVEKMDDQTNSDGDDSNKRSPNEQKQPHSELNSNCKRPHSTVDCDNNNGVSRDNKPKVIKLNSGQHLNDIGLMRRKAALNQPTSNHHDNHADHTGGHVRSRIGNHRFGSHQQDEDITDLREKLNRMRQQNRQPVDAEQPEAEQTNSDANEDDSGANEDKKEKCRFWPLCKNGLNCVYFHPTEQCVAFPTCKLGEKCLFIHPLCKFDAICAKKDCPFTHITKKSAAHPAPVATMCKFFPNCFNPACTFLHPKVSHCRLTCRTPSNLNPFLTFVSFLFRCACSDPTAKTAIAHSLTRTRKVQWPDLINSNGVRKRTTGKRSITKT
jgi:hypothetical protein